MCDPISLAVASVAVSAASSVSGYVGQRQAAKAQEMAAQDAYIANQAALDVQQQQTNEQASQKMSERVRQAMIERGRLRALAAEGMGGQSTARLEGEIDLATATDMAVIERNRSMNEAQAQLQKRGMRAQSQGAINASQRPSPLGLAIDLAGTALSGASKLKIPTNTPDWNPTGSRDYW